MNPRRSELFDHIIFKRYEKLGHTWIPLSTRTTSDLQVNSSALHPLGTNHNQSAQVCYPWTEFDICPSTCHRSRNGHCPHLSRLCDDLGFTRRMIGIKDIVGNPLSQEQGRVKLGHFNRTDKDKEWIPLGVIGLDCFQRGIHFLREGHIEIIRIVHSPKWAIGRDTNDRHIVGFEKLFFCHLSRTCHT